MYIESIGGGEISIFGVLAEGEKLAIDDFHDRLRVIIIDMISWSIILYQL